MSFASYKARLVSRTMILAVAVSAFAATFAVSSAWAERGIESFTASTTTSVAGAHPDVSTSFVAKGPSVVLADGVIGSINVALPPGLIGNPNAVPQCPIETINSSANALQQYQRCGAATQVGVASVVASINSGSGGIFGRFDAVVLNVEPGPEEPARLLLVLASEGLAPGTWLTVNARTDEDFGIDTLSAEIDGTLFVKSAAVTIWGVPSAHTRGGPQTVCAHETLDSCSTTTPVPALLPAPTAEQKPFLTNPTVCDNPKVTTLAVNYAEDLATPVTATASNPTPTECENVPFDPSISFQPDNTQADTPAGYDVDLHVPQSEDPNGIATSHLRNAIVTLPEGVSVNPAAADGLGACSEQQIGYLGNEFAYPNPIRFSKADPGCPLNSKIGTVEVETPVLSDPPLSGSVYVAKPYENPFGTLMGIYLVVQGHGLTVKLAGKVEPDPVTGQLKATFDDNPQVPFTDFKLHFKSGARAPLANPSTCGVKKTTTSLTPWSGNPAATPSDQFAISTAPGGVCGNGLADRPFGLGFAAGTTNPLAGSHSPFTLRLTRPDGAQEISSIDAAMPPGFAATLRGVPYCPEAAIAAASTLSGKAEQATPSCPVASQIGTLTTGAGAGSAPLYVGGKAYLAGPYKGAPLSAVFVTPAVAGPYDLGNVVVRAALYVDPVTAQVTVKSDPIPQILKGVPLRVRDVRVDIDRPSFTLNPTSCDAMAVSAHVTGSSGASADLSNRFQVGGCSSLGFSPKLKLSLKGGTKRSKFPALTAVLTQPPGQANIDRVAVTLPHSEFLEQGHIRTVCTRVQYAANACPAGSVYGYAIAESPLLDKPLEGPVYLRSNPEHELPDLVAALRGQINVDLAGRIDSVNGGIRNTFDIVPDAPVSRFVLKMQGGKKGLLVNSRDICKSTNRATVLIDGQNGKTADQRPKLTNSSCKKAKKQKRRSRATR